MSLDEETYSPDTSIAGRIFYLSIPPNTYPKTVASLYKYCRPLAHGSWQRLVLEKPFGSDRKTAETLAQSLSQWFNENEIYRVDHYLQKPIVRHILPFRFANANWLEHILNRHHVDRVEVVSKEILGVKGRTKFYNQVGVVRDMLQNHLTELLTLITMELPSHLDAANYEEIQRKKIDLLEQVKPVDSKNILFAQYKEYMQEAVKDGINKSSSAKTATFAATQVFIQSARWKNVPFILVAGKQLDEKATYVRIIFKRNTFPIPYPAEGQNLQQIVFHIAYGSMKEHSILVTKTLGNPTWPPGIISKHWAQPPAYDAEMSSFYMAGPEFESDAYCQVVQDIIQGRQSSFVGTAQLLNMWDIWQPVLNVLSKRPKLYTRNSSLDFFVYDNRLQFITEEDTQPVHVEIQQDEKRFGQVPSHFRGGTLYVNSTNEIAVQLALSIIDEAVIMIKRKKSFHIGFSGGKTPALLLAQLREHYPLHLWVYTHVWLVDDRCQHLDSHRSNFNLLYTELLQHVNIPYINIHPMPVSIAGSLCLDADQGDLLYEKQLTVALGDGGLDYTILGLVLYLSPSLSFIYFFFNNV
ncbi:H6PD [Acanthosepion pharaonis]|uniref:H6PD n=1 Tax=Acanthosepion pharaonis TaxID=158019 RepID=A0A812BM44_ACAPH|nr:H6PD [Sepia pharaonis]